MKHECVPWEAYDSSILIFAAEYLSMRSVQKVTPVSYYQTKQWEKNNLLYTQNMYRLKLLLNSHLWKWGTYIGE
jgi:hypothetical protein